MQTSIALTPTRRSMLAAPIHCTVHQLLAPLVVPLNDLRPAEEAQRDLARIIQEVEKLVQADANFKQALRSLADWAAGPLKPGYSELYLRVGRPDSNALKTFISVTYARAVWALRNSHADSKFIFADTTQILQNSAAAVQRLREAMDRLGPNFISHLVTEAEIRVAEDPEFEKVMAEAAEAFRQLEPKGKAAPTQVQTRAPSREAAGVIPLTGENLNQWWALPSLVALASTIWQ